MFLALTITNYSEDSYEEDVIFFFSKKDDSWKIEKRKGLMSFHDADWMIGDIIEELQKEDAKAK